MMIRTICCDCDNEVPSGTLGRCPVCRGVLRPAYPDEAVNQLAMIEPGPGIDRYRAILPVSIAIPSLGEGDTPLLASRRLGSALGCKNLFLKNEGRNPTGAFKDRSGALATALAIEARAKGVLTASSGNAASAISAYCARAGLPCLILLEPGNPPTKLRQALATGAQALLVQGIFAHGPDALQDLLLELAASLGYYLAFIWAPVNPYILEGIKTVSYEVAAQLAGAPDVLICPVGGGDLFVAQWRGYMELKHAGVIKKTPRMVAVQSVNAPPLLRAFESGADRVPPLSYANSKISGINAPFTGEHALATVRESGGVVIGVNDGEVLEMQRRLGLEEGIWVEPASAAPLAAIPNLLARKEIHPGDRIVCVLSGAGFKDAHLAEAEAAEIGRREPAPFNVAEIARRVSLTAD